MLLKQNFKRSLKRLSHIIRKTRRNAYKSYASGLVERGSHCEASYSNDQQCLQQAILVAQHNNVDLEEVKRWSATEGKLAAFEKIYILLQPRKS